MRRGNGGPTKHSVDFCTCGKKKSTQTQAKKEAKFLKYNKKYSGFKPIAYKCKTSGWWHVGNSVL